METQVSTFPLSMFYSRLEIACRGLLYLLIATLPVLIEALKSRPVDWPLVAAEMGLAGAVAVRAYFDHSSAKAPEDPKIYVNLPPARTYPPGQAGAALAREQADQSVAG